jgi:mono/diheme cytochrome c family protein
MRPRRGVVSPRAAVATAVGALVITISGCGSGGTGDATGSRGITLQSPGSGSGGAVTGSALFAEHCAICHSVSGNRYSRKDGGDLRHLHLPRYELVQFTAEMPAVHGRLTGAQVQTIVSYLQSLARRR